MLKVNAQDLKKVAKHLAKFAKNVAVHTTRNALNTLAFTARSEWQSEMQKTLTLRNKYTVGAVRVEKVKGYGFPMQSVTGSIAPYMADTDAGGTVKGMHGLKSIPTTTAGRPQLVKPRYRLGKINVPHSASQGSRKRRNAVSIAIAKSKGIKFALLERAKGGKGIFQLGGGKRNVKVKMIWGFRSSVHVSAHPTLGPALERVQAKSSRIWVGTLISQLRRNKVFGY